MSTSVQSQMQVGIHQIPKSKWKFLLLALQHVFAMFGANILVPILVNNAAGQVIIPLQVAFFCSGIGTIIYLIVTGFKTPIYLGSSFAFLGGMTTLYTTTGYNVFFSLMIVGLIYVIIAAIIFYTKKASSIKKLLSPVIVGPAIMMIGWGMMGNAAKDSYLNPANLGTITNDNIGTLWALISIAVVTFAIIVIAMIYLKGIWKMIPILLGIIGGIGFSVVVWGIAKGAGNTQLAEILYGEQNYGVKALLSPDQWQWYPDITTMWRNPASHVDFKIEAYLAIVPLVIVTLAEHIGDHINIGNLTGNDFITSKPGVYRTLIGDGLATIVSASMGGPANTSYGENTSVIAVTKVASVWVIFLAAIISILISFVAPISLILSAIPKPVIGGIEIILFSMIAINGLRILFTAKDELFVSRNIVLIAILAITGLGGTVLILAPDINGTAMALTGSGVGVIICVILNLILPSNPLETNAKVISSLDFTPSDFFKVTSFSRKKHAAKKPAKKAKK